MQLNLKKQFILLLIQDKKVLLKILIQLTYLPLLKRCIRLQ